MRQINPMIERTPEGFDVQVKAAIQEIGSELLLEMGSMLCSASLPDRLYGGFIAFLIYVVCETGQEEL
jgi:hypothetical protein